MEDARDTLRRALGIQEVRGHYQTFSIDRGQIALVGSNPQDSPSAVKSGKKLIKIVGPADHQLSRAAVSVGLDQDGAPMIINETDNNEVDINYLDGNWKKYRLLPHRPPVAALVGKFKDSFVIDILTGDKTLVRLNSAGNSSGSNGPGISTITFRVEINPKQPDLNAH